MDAALTHTRIAVVRRRRRASLTTTAARLARRFAAHVQAGSSAPVWTTSAAAQFSLLPRGEQDRQLRRGMRATS